MGGAAVGLEGAGKPASDEEERNPAARSLTDERHLLPGTCLFGCLLPWGFSLELTLVARSLDRIIGVGFGG